MSLWINFQISSKLLDLLNNAEDVNKKESIKNISNLSKVTIHDSVFIVPEIDIVLLVRYLNKVEFNAISLLLRYLFSFELD